MTDTMLSPFLALHAVQAVPPSLLNRDDVGAVKKITLGGVPRVRVSSQSWKRAIRVGMRSAAIDGGAFGLRTTRFPRLTAEILTAEHGIHPERAAVIASAVFTELGLKANEKTGNTAVAVFASELLPGRVAAALAAHDSAITVTDATDPDDSAATGKGKKKKAVRIPDAVLATARAGLDVDATIDLALFGRMLAEIPGSGVDGAVAVAHAFSVDPLALEPDFFTAVDDAAVDGEAMSNMLDTTDLTAPTLYQYAELDRCQLRTNLAGAGDTHTVERLACAAEASFVEWFVRATPSGKHRSTGAHTLPMLVLAEPARFAYSLADAFSPAITGDTVATDACTRLLRHARAARPYTGSPAVTALVINPTVGDPLDLDGFETATDFADLIAGTQR